MALPATLFLHRMGVDCVWLLEAHQETREMCTEFLRFDAFEVVAFEHPEQLLSDNSETPRAAIIDAWTARSSEPAIVGRLSCRHLIVTSTTLPLRDLWRRLGVARVYLKPVSIDEVRADVHEMAERSSPPTSRTLPCFARDEQEPWVASRRPRSRR